MFEDQVRAYELALACPELKQRVPRFFGRCTVSEVVCCCGKSYAGDYMLDCCYSMEWVEGTTCKLQDAKHEYSYLQDLVSLFHKAGILYTVDASVINAGDKQRALLIDFGTRDIQLDHEELPLNY